MGSDTDTSRWLSWALRHRPAEAGITLDEQGWTPVEALLQAAARHGHRLDRDELATLVASNDKRRFSLSDDGERIRANQGHTVPVDLGMAAATPPAVLWHGTVARFLPAILRDGLMRGQRHHVHLSAERATAIAVGNRRGEAVLLRIAAADMHAAGSVFYRSANGVWLVDAVPACHLAVVTDD